MAREKKIDKKQYTEVKDEDTNSVFSASFSFFRMSLFGRKPQKKKEEYPVVKPVSSGKKKETASKIDSFSYQHSESFNDNKKNRCVIL